MGTFYLTLVTIHIIFAGMWLTNILSDSFFKKRIAEVKGKVSEKRMISGYLKYSNMAGSVSAMGILITGIILVAYSAAYGFFDFSANHWLATKQIIMVFILIIIGAKLIPNSKKLRLAIGNDLDSSETLSEETYKNLKSVFTINNRISILVILNFLLALSRRYM